MDKITFNEIEASECESIGGGIYPASFINPWLLGGMAAFGIGAIAGSYIDQRWIKPLWNN